MSTFLGFKQHLDKDESIRLLPAKDFELIEDSIYNILQTLPGERVHDPNFGCSLRILIFEPLDEFLAYQIKTEVSKALTKYEDRISVIDVDVALPGEFDEDLDRVQVVVRYMLKKLKDVRNFTIKF